MRSGLTTLVAAATAVLLLAGCGSPGVADGVRPGVPSGLGLDPGDGPVAVWLDEGARFAVVTWGSSSCPAVATSLTATAADRLSLTFAASSNDPCTADMAPTTHEFVLPDAVTGRPVTISITYEDRDGADTLTLE